MTKLDSGLSEDVADDESLARFLFHSNQYNAKMVKPAAFLPHPRDYETSVSRHGATPLDALEGLGRLAAGGCTHCMGQPSFVHRLLRGPR